MKASERAEDILGTECTTGGLKALLVKHIEAAEHEAAEDAIRWTVRQALEGDDEEQIRDTIEAYWKHLEAKP